MDADVNIVVEVGKGTPEFATFASSWPGRQGHRHLGRTERPCCLLQYR